MDFEMFRSMTPEEKAKTLRDPNLVKNVESQFAKPPSMETTYEKNSSPYSSYTQNNKMSERVSRLLRQLGKSANAGVVSYDMEPLMDFKKNKSEVAPLESTEIVKTIKPDILGKQKINPAPGIAMTPEVVDNLKSQSDALANKRIDLERERRMNEYDQRARARRMKVQDTLEKTGLDRR